MSAPSDGGSDGASSVEDVAGADAAGVVDVAGEDASSVGDAAGGDVPTADAGGLEDVPDAEVAPPEDAIAAPDDANPVVDAGVSPPDDASAPLDVPLATDAQDPTDTVAPPDDGSETAPTCPTVAVPEPIAEAPLAGMSPPATVETHVGGGFTDDYLVDGTGYTKIATRREWGATIVFFGLTGAGPLLNGSNVIDANDTGREVQIALYDPARSMQGCAVDASCQTNPGGACPSSITFLGWNPVQGGNQCNIGSGVQTVSTPPGALEAVVIPKHWNPDWQEPGCVDSGCADPVKKQLTSDVRYTQRLRYIHPLLVELSMTVENLSDVAHLATAQEFPTLYAAYGTNGPDLRVLLDSGGTAIAIDQPANDGFFTRTFDSPGPWTTLQNVNQDYGVGIYYENRISTFQGWQKLGVFNNVRSVFVFGLPAKATVHARAYLALGSFTTIQSTFQALDQNLPPFGALDSPSAEATVGNALAVSGWVLDNKGISGVTLRLDGAPIAALPLDQPRPDVCTAWPGYSMCSTVGFAQTVPLSGVSACHHVVEVVATDTDGNTRVIAARRIRVVDPSQCAGPETCNGLDDDCDGETDEAGASGCTPYHHDGDADGFGTAATACLCAPAAPYTALQGGDCADDDGSVHPTAPETCNGVDDDCDTVIDSPSCAAATHPVYRFLRTSGGTDHALGTSAAPAAGYQLEGTAFLLFDAPAPGRQALYQVWCPTCVDHMPTLSPTEGAPDYGSPVLLGYCATAAAPDAPHKATRVYSASKTDHFMTTDPVELTNVQSAGYTLEWSCQVP